MLPMIFIKIYCYKILYTHKYPTRTFQVIWIWRKVLSIFSASLHKWNKSLNYLSFTYRVYSILPNKCQYRLHTTSPAWKNQGDKILQSFAFHKMRLNNVKSRAAIFVHFAWHDTQHSTEEQPIRGKQLN